jgi:hypothetical protein
MSVCSPLPRFMLCLVALCLTFATFRKKVPFCHTREAVPTWEDSSPPPFVIRILAPSHRHRPSSLALVTLHALINPYTTQDTVANRLYNCSAIFSACRHHLDSPRTPTPTAPLSPYDAVRDIAPVENSEKVNLNLPSFTPTNPRQTSPP